MIDMLQALQAREGYLSEESLRALSRRTGRSLVDIYGVATFYRSFSLKPRGKHLICACLGTACHVRGAPKIAEELERRLAIKAGQTTPDGEFTLETVNCLGACALGPVVVVDGRCFPNVHASSVGGILVKARAGLAPARPSAQAAGK
jgi:NADH-quinone oxidoreductase subunit E